MHHHVTILDAQVVEGLFDVFRSSIERDCTDDNLDERCSEVSVAHSNLKSEDWEVFRLYEMSAELSKHEDLSFFLEPATFQCFCFWIDL